MALVTSKQLVIDSINSTNSATITSPLTQTDIDLTIPVTNTTDPENGAEVQSVVSVLPTSSLDPVSAPMTVTYTRKDLSELFTGIVPIITDPSVTTKQTLLAALNAKYATDIKDSDIADLEAPVISGTAVVLQAAPDSYGFRGSLSVGLNVISLKEVSVPSGVTFECPSSHAYVREDGLIDYAPANTWPLEYRNGVVVGRHEPEPTRTNLNVDTTLAGSTGVRTTLSATTEKALFEADINIKVTEMAVNGGHYFYAQNTYTITNQKVYAASSFISRWTRPCAWLTYRNPGTQTSTIFYDFDSGADAVYLNHPDDVTGTVHLGEWVRLIGVGAASANTHALGYLFCGPATTITTGSSGYLGSVTEGQYQAAQQLEMVGDGEPWVATSPICTPLVPATRQASKITFTVEPEYNGVRLYCSTGEYFDISAIDGVCTLPYLAKHWGERYLTGFVYLS